MLVMRVIAAHRRLAGGAICGLLSVPFLPATMSPLSRAIIAWDIGCTAFLVLVALMFSTERLSRIAADAAAQREGEWTVFWLAFAAAAASVAALVGDYAAAAKLPASLHGLHIVLVAVTLLLSWLMMHTLFALRYAHGYYSHRASDAAGQNIRGGLEFPGGEPPDYWDFFYFSLVLGMACQTADVQITTRRMRHLATAHGFVAFVFNAVILALSVNFGASLL
jgi:uncharacterized membrane protein